MTVALWLRHPDWPQMHTVILSGLDQRPFHLAVPNSLVRTMAPKESTPLMDPGTVPGVPGRNFGEG